MINNKRVVAVTLARGGSKSIPQKNIAVLCGKPLIEYTFNEVARSQYIDAYYVSTDSEAVMQCAQSKGVLTIDRPSELSQDHSTSAEALLHAVDYVGACDYFVEIMCTNPLKTVEDIDACILKLDETQADSVVSVVRIYDHHPSRVKYIENDLLADFYPEVPESRRQDLSPPAYVRNGSIYAMKIDTLLRYNNRLGGTVRPYVMPAERSINIDEPHDLLIAEQMIKDKQ